MDFSPQRGGAWP